MLVLSRLRLITFDVTDTLLKFKTRLAQQYGHVGSVYGVQVDKGKLTTSFQKNWRRMIKEHPNFGLHSGLGWKNWWAEVVKSTFKQSNINVSELDEKMLDSVATHLIEAYKMSASWEHCNGVLDILSYLKSRSIPVGVISNFDPRLHETLKNAKLRHYFQFVLTSYEAGVEKPHPKIFEQAMKISKVKDIRSDECLHVGDKPLTDYQGAVNAGWQAALISETPIHDLKGKYPEIDPNHVFASLLDLHKYILERSKAEVATCAL